MPLAAARGGPDLGPPPQAPAHQLVEMENQMRTLEELLKEIEDVSSIIEFNVAGAGASTERGLFRAAGGGAAVLAQSVAEDLNRWHQRNEVHVADHGRKHAERLRQSVEMQKAAQESRERVRDAVRQHLFQISNAALSECIDTVNATCKKTFKDKGAEVGNSLEAYHNLQNRMEAATSFMSHLEATPPPEMIVGTQAANLAVQRKEQRAVGRRQRLPDLEAHLDEELLMEASESMRRRQLDLENQCELQAEALRHLDSHQRARKQEKEELIEGLAKATKSRAAEPWKVLWPTHLQDPKEGGMQRLQATKLDFQGKFVMPELSANLEEAIAQTLKPQLQHQGAARIKTLRQEFYESYLAKDSGERARTVGSELERWQLKAKIELLKDLLQVSQSNHAGIMDQLRASLGGFGKNSDEGNYERTVQSAEQFHTQRANFFDGQVEAAELAIVNFCDQSLEKILSLRRRTELASLKRWNDVGVGLNLTLDGSWSKCQLQLAEEVRRSLYEVHKSMELPVVNLDVEKGRKQVEMVSVAWKRCGTHTPQQLNFLETITKALPNTPESCTVTKAALVLLEDEVKRIAQKLQTAKDSAAGAAVS